MCVGLNESALRMASQSVRPFLQGSPVCPKYRSTQTTERATSVEIGRIYAMYAMRLNNRFT